MLIADNHVRLLILTKLIESGIDSKEEDAALREDQLTALRSLAATDLAALAKMREPKIRVHLDPVEVDHGLRQLNYSRQRQRQIEYFISNGATTSMLTHLFKLSMADIVAHRAKSGRTVHRRPSMPPPRVREAICNDWYALRLGRERTTPTAEDYISLHRKHPQFSLATLTAVLDEFRKDQTARQNP